LIIPPTKSKSNHSKYILNPNESLDNNMRSSDIKESITSKYKNVKNINENLKTKGLLKKPGYINRRFPSFIERKC